MVELGLEKRLAEGVCDRGARNRGINVGIFRAQKDISDVAERLGTSMVILRESSQSDAGR